jgi:PAS domain S-box-containing protein
MTSASFNDGNIRFEVDGLAHLDAFVPAVSDHSGDKFALAFHASPDAIAITRLSDGVYLEINEGLTRMFGRTAEEVLGRTSLELGIWDDLADRDRWAAALREKGRVDNLEVKFRRADGGLVFGLVSSRTLTWANDLVQLSITRDISDLKRSQEENALLIQKLNEAQSIANIGSWDWDIATHRIWWSKEVYRIFGVTPEEYTPSAESNAKFYHPDDLESFNAIFENSIETGTPFSFDLRLILRDGQQKHCLAKAEVSCDESGKPIRMTGIIMDVTERKTIEKLLNQILIDLKETQNIAHVGSWSMDSATNKLFWSDELYKIFGFDNNQALPPFEEQGRFFTPDSWERLSTAVANTATEGIPYKLELETVRKDGSRGWMWAFGKADRDSNGRITRVHGAAQDITNRKWSEERFRAMFEVSPIPFALNGTDGRIPFLNPAFTTTFGYTVQDIPDLESWWRRAYPDPAYRDWVVSTCGERLARAEREGCAFEPLEVEVHCRNGTHRSVIATSVELKGVNDASHLVALYDITERKKNEAALQESNQRIQLATESAHLAVWDWNLRSGTMVWDDRMFELYGTTRFEIVGTVEDWKNGLHPADLDRALAECEAAIKGEAPFNTEFRVRHRDGTVLWIKANATVLRDEQGNPVRMVGVNRDITERKLAEETTARLQSQLLHSQKMESLGSLAGGVAHDINNVLAAIQAIASLHRQLGKDDPRIQVDMETIATACQRGGMLTRGLLTFARQGLGEEQLIDLNAVVREEVALLARTTLQKVNLDLDLGEDLLRVKGDPAALSHCLMNLCVNAVDAMPEGGALTLRTRNEAGGMVLLEVVDTGSGMPKETLARAVEPFFTTKPQGKGTGLGLSIVYGTVKAHQGRMEIQSEPGTGTRVMMHFPAAGRFPVEANLAMEPDQDPSEGTLHVLLVDDDELIRCSVPAILEHLGHTVSVAAGGEEAVAVVRAGLRPDVVILDMNMPGLDGPGTLPQIRALCPAVPILLSTGREDQTARDLVTDHAFVSLLSKPYGIEELEQKLQAMTSD